MAAAAAAAVVVVVRGRGRVGEEQTFCVTGFFKGLLVIRDRDPCVVRYTSLGAFNCFIWILVCFSKEPWSLVWDQGVGRGSLCGFVAPL